MCCQTSVQATSTSPHMGVEIATTALTVAGWPPSIHGTSGIPHGSFRRRKSAAQTTDSNGDKQALRWVSLPLRQTRSERKYQHMASSLAHHASNCILHDCAAHLNRQLSLNVGHWRLPPAASCHGIASLQEAIQQPIVVSLLPIQ